jgi:hypothetical protein
MMGAINNFFYSSAHQFTFPIGYGKKANSQILSKIKIKLKKKNQPRQDDVHGVPLVQMRERDEEDVLPAADLGHQGVEVHQILEVG